MFDFLEHPLVEKMMTDFPLVLDSNNPKHIFIFRRLLEWSMTHGRWSGQMGDLS